MTSRRCGPSTRRWLLQVDADPFITAVAEAIDGTIERNFTGSSRELLTRSTPDGDGKWRAPKGWPMTSRAVTSKLRRQAPVLRKAGWVVTDHGDKNKNGVAIWTLTPPVRPEKAGKDTPPSPPSPPNGPDQGKRGGDAERQAGNGAGQAGEGGVNGEGGGLADLGATRCPDCAEPYDSIDHQINCEGLDVSTPCPDCGWPPGSEGHAHLGGKS
jgi:hypothetical protein